MAIQDYSIEGHSNASKGLQPRHQGCRLKEGGDREAYREGIERERTTNI